ncbi:MAG: hypothetical protein AB7S38_24060 [Vulcanimicrobiota bacterium]
MIITSNPISKPTLTRKPNAPEAQASAARPTAPAAAPANPIEEFFAGIGKLLFGEHKSDLGNDGRKEEVFSADPKADDRRSMIFVGGAGTKFEDSKDEAKYLADRLGRDVTLIHNATEIPEIEGGLFSFLTAPAATLEGAGKDLAQVADDFEGKGNDPAVDAVKTEVRNRLLRGADKVDLLGSSQGNAIIMRALRELNEEPGMDVLMDKINVVNMMGPVRQQDYPEGVHYQHVEMATDPVTQLLGENVPQAELADRQARYRDRVFTLPQLMLAGGWPGHNPHAILGPAPGGSNIDDHELGTLHLTRAELLAQQAENVRRITDLFDGAQQA